MANPLSDRQLEKLRIARIKLDRLALDIFRMQETLEKISGHPVIEDKDMKPYPYAAKQPIKMSVFTELSDALYQKLDEYPLPKT